MNILLYAFIVIMVCTAIMCIYGVWIATLLTIELIQEWWKGHGNEIKRVFKGKEKE